ncbi:MAG: DNA adenine methylase [Deltaproteobacteria bacterium]|nr:DNA adenine methylase [Deltaproteobacteria bacterium]MBK8713680.1 DNA adenine methylase [Deltaproteobacteria bacterium]MBP7288845.1 DNA adenine methylase [Nannocystaceae bacterium]
MIKYLGSKRLLLPQICEVIAALGQGATVLDAFAGTSRVGHALKARGLKVVANDHNAYAATLARCYVQADREDVLADATRLVQHYNRLPGRAGYFTETFCERSRFFQPRNGERIDAIREAIAVDGLAPELEAVMLTSLMEAADRVDSTTGVQMAYLKQWAPRAYNPLELRVPELLPRARGGKGHAHCRDALELAGDVEVDIAYLDPPYNQHKYLGNYHIWESLVRWDKPEVYGTACKRIDCRERTSAFNSKPNAAAAITGLVDRVRARFVVLSFNSDGYFTREGMETLLRGRGLVAVHEHDTKRYVGAQIGIYDPRGRKVGRVGALRNKEFLFVLDLRAAGAGASATSS